ncbi:MAG: serine hydrolase [Bacteroidales bacterium]
MKKLAHFLTLLLLFVLLGKGEAVAQNFIYPNTEWSVASPEKYGFNSAKLKEARKYIAQNMQTTGMTVIVGGEQIFSYGNLERISYIASCRKSILSMMYGKYVENGTIDLNRTLADLKIDDVGGLLPIEKKATIRDIISARSGIYHEASYPGDDTEYAPQRASIEPGSYYLYNNWDFNVAGTIFEQLTGEDIYEAFIKDIGSQIELQDFKLSQQSKEGNPKRSIHMAYPFHFSTRDMARVGYLMLRNGKWKNREVISKEWIKESISLHTPNSQMNPPFRKEQNFGYGYMWWVWDGPNVPELLKGAYSARGAIGQYITVIPKLDMVIAHKTDSVYGRKTLFTQYWGFLQLLLDAKEKK